MCVKKDTLPIRRSLKKLGETYGVGSKVQKNNGHD